MLKTKIVKTEILTRNVGKRNCDFVLENLEVRKDFEKKKKCLRYLENFGRRLEKFWENRNTNKFWKSDLKMFW